MNTEPSDLTLDVRDDLRCGTPPCDRIQTTARTVPAGGRFTLVTPFEPVPLYSVLGSLGFSHQTTRIDDHHWSTLFIRDQEASIDPLAPPPTCGCTPAPSPDVEVDARGLEPPQPMVRIFEALATLPPGTALVARTDRRPMHLLEALSARGFQHASQEEADGSWITTIRQA